MEVENNCCSQNEKEGPNVESESSSRPASPPPNIWPTLIVEGVNFFLYQRNQIPLPFDRIGKCTNAEECRFDMKYNSFGDKKTQQNVIEDQNNFSQVKQRIQILKQQRHERLLEKRRSVLKKKQKRDEEKIRNCWDSVHKVLHNIFEVRERKTLCKAIVLMFGHTIFNPRETIIFEMDFDYKEGDETLCQLTSTDNVQVTVRKFFKSIIMSNQFPEFTSKPLQKIRSHLCMVFELPIPNLEIDQNYKNDLILLEDFCIAKPLQRKTSVQSVFHIRIKLSDNSFQVVDNEFDLFNKNSFFYYQIPFQFKGIQWRNK